MFEWLRKAPWGNPAFAGMFLSLVMFGFLGGISGVVLGTEQINLIMHNTLYVPGHFHAHRGRRARRSRSWRSPICVVPLIFRREVMFPKLAKLQPYLFGIGIAGHLAVHDGCRHARRAAPALGHHVRAMR